MLATKISFMNEIANVCELFGADVDRVRQAIGADRRIGTAFLFPGVGYGGSCFPKDVKALDQVLGRQEVRLQDSEGGRGRQRAPEARAGEEDRGALRRQLKGKTIAVWGLAFKPKTDDMREAPAVPIIEALLAKGAKVQAYDPEAMKVAKGIFGTRDHLRRARTTTRSRAPTRWRWSPSGRSSASPTSRGCKKLMRAPVDLRRPQHLPARRR